MEATTYHDPRVQELLAKHFVAAKVDVDARPDIEERYGAWGWPATILFSADGEELGKYKGYVAPDAFVQALRAALDGKVLGVRETPRAKAAPLGEEAHALAYDFVRAELDEYYDDEQGGWGRRQKAAVAMNDVWTLGRARAGDDARRRQAVFTLDREQRLLDPVWGGMYQYSAAGDWEHPHFEKLTTFQAGALESFALGYAVTKEPRYLASARGVRRYVDAFLTSPEGGFYASQDADLNAQEPGKAYLAGGRYYALGDRERRALGSPRVDTHEYGRENGLAVAAYVTFYEATGDRSALDAAARAALRVEATHATPRGGISHDVARPGDASPLYLADNAAYLWAAVRLHEATRDAAWLGRAARVADFLVRDLEDKEGGGFFGQTEDTSAVGVLRQRRKPPEENVTALRALSRLVRSRPDDGHARALRMGVRPQVEADVVKARGRRLGDLLLLLEEVR